MSFSFVPFHPLGEPDLDNQLTGSQSFPVDTYGGRIHVEWDPQAAVTPLGQLAFFIEFLKTADLFEPWVEDCPLHYLSNNAPSKRDVLGTFLLSFLAGHERYAHITTLRCDQVNPELLGMVKVISEDSARRALVKIEEAQGIEWLSKHLQKCYLPLLSTPWILDVDTTVKPLYGHQEGAEIGYNPTKPGRPSHNYHSYYISNIRVLLDVDVQDGKSHAGYYSANRLWRLLDEIPQHCWPQFIRGDSSYGNESIMTAAEKRGIDYLFKLKSTPKVKQLISMLMERRGWVDAGKNWEGMESALRLSGWSRARRVIVLRRRLPKKDVGILKEESDGEARQLTLQFLEIDKDASLYEYAVLVTRLPDEITTIAQHYRDRSDSENNFDELKNQWGWCGFTTQDLKRCRIIAKMIALVYNWWTLFARLVNPDSHLEAITSRPLLLHAVAKQTKHAGQTKLTITSTHGKAQRVAEVLTRISGFLKHLKNDAEHLTSSQRLHEILVVAFHKFLRNNGPAPPKLLSAPS